MDSNAEQTFVSNGFGAVTSKRVIYQRAKGWLSGGSREDIPLQHVTAVRLETSRSVVGGVLLLLIGLSMLAGDSGAIKFLALVVLCLAVLCLWGSPKVIVNTSGNDLRAAGGPPWQRSEALAFVEALRTQLFKG